MSDTPISDGGPAFPVAGFQFKNKDGSEGFVLPMEGMTLRDYFAARAINEVGWYNNIHQSAIMAYEIADAMLKAGGRNERSYS